MALTLAPIAVSADFAFDEGATVISDFDTVDDWNVDDGSSPILTSVDESTVGLEAPSGPNVADVAFDSGGADNMWINDGVGGQMTDIALWYNFTENGQNWDSNPTIDLFDADQTGGGADNADRFVEQGIPRGQDEWRRMRITLNWATQSYRYVVVDRDGTLISQGESDFTQSANQVQSFGISANDGSGSDGERANTDAYFDYLITDSEPAIHAIFGTVTDTDGNELNQTLVQAERNGNIIRSDTTGASGQYELVVSDGEYNVTASKDGYFNETVEVTVDEASVEQNIELLNSTGALELQVRPFLEHGQRAPYTVIESVPNQTTGERTPSEVTEQATVTSNDPSVVIADMNSLEALATSDTSVNARTYLTAEWTNPETGDTLTDTQNVTVANSTVNNLKILPPVNRFTAPFSGGTDANPDDKTILIIVIAVGAGVVAGRWATSFAGGAATVMIFEMGWIMGLVGDGMAIVAVFIGTFVLLNVAGNVDYTVRRG